MSHRIGRKDLEGVVDRLNKITGSPETPWTKGDDGKFRANVGNYHLDWAYGGVKLVKMCSEGGGITTITSGYNSKRETYYLIHAYMDGIMAAKA